MSVKHLLFSLKGRINRQRYWLGALATFPIFIIIGIIVGGIFAADKFDEKSLYKKFIIETNYTGNYEELIALHAVYHKTQHDYPAYDKKTLAYQTCKSLKDNLPKAYKTTSCEEFSAKIPALEAKLPPDNGKIGMNSARLLILFITLSVAGFLSFWINIALTAKRLQDLNYSGAWQAVPYIMNICTELANSKSYI